MSDPRDMFGPPEAPLECYCERCRHIFMSDLLIKIDLETEVRWMCPVPRCGGMGYTLDIFPTDSTHPDARRYPFDDPFDDPFSDVEASDEDDDENSEWYDDDEDPFMPDDGELIANDIAGREGKFDPPRDWTPESDREDDEFEFEFDSDTDSDDDIPIFDWPGSDHDGDFTLPYSTHFTREDYLAAHQAGLYDAAIAYWQAFAKLERERKSRIESGETIPGDMFDENDIPF